MNMIIDFHCHLFRKSQFPDYFWDGEARLFERYFESQGKHVELEWVKQELLPLFWEEHDRLLVKQMDEAGINKTVILHVDFSYGRDEALQPIEEQYNEVNDTVKKHPDRLIYFMGIDPRRANSWAPLIEKHNDYGVRGVKLDPVAGFSPDEEICFSLYERIAELKLPVMVHQGPLFEPFDSHSSHPYKLQKALAAFPQVTFIGAHMAFEWWRQLMEIGKKHENLMCDISGWQLVALSNPRLFQHILRKMIDAIGSERILFGTDSATFDYFMSKKQWLAFIKSLSSQGEKKDMITEKEMEALLGGNAMRLLGFSN